MKKQYKIEKLDNGCVLTEDSETFAISSYLNLRDRLRKQVDDMITKLYDSEEKTIEITLESQFCDEISLSEEDKKESIIPPVSCMARPIPPSNTSESPS